MQKAQPNTLLKFRSRIGINPIIEGLKLKLTPFFFFFFFKEYLSYLFILTTCRKVVTIGGATVGIK